jgi:acyl-CoA dehydrogenase
MNFEFSEEQQMLRDQARGFLSQHCPPSAVRTALDSDAPFDAELWRKVADMGWMATVIPEEYGGLGLSYYELAVIAEEMGRAVAPIPFSSSVYLASEALLQFGTEALRERWLPKLAEGSVIGTFAFAEGIGRPCADTITATFSGGSLSGTKLPVPDGDIADLVIVVAKDAASQAMGLYAVDCAQSGVRRDELQTLDFSRSHATLHFDNVQAEPLQADGETTIAALLDRAAVLFGWEQIGLADAALEQAREYAMQRYAFGRQIGSYQAIKHKLAAVYAKNSLARSNGYYGAWALQEKSSDLTLAAATVRVAGIQASLFATQENIQTHGGMGFTWEFDCQFYYRRARLLASVVGSEAMWQDRLVGELDRSSAAVA